MKKKNLTFLVVNKNVIDVFLLNHLKLLNKFYDISFISPINSKNIKIDNNYYSNQFIKIKRGLNLFNFFSCFLILLFFIKKNSNNLYISIHPKNGFLLCICKFFLKFTSLHIITGQIWANKKGLNKIILKFLDHLIFTKNDYLLVDSYSQISFLKKQGFFYNFECINYGSICGVDIKKFKKSKLDKLSFQKKYNLPLNSKFILYVGRINFSKGINILIKAFDQIIQKNDNYFLIIVGSDEINFNSLLNKYSNNLKLKVIKFEHSSNIMFYYSIADIFCLPSLREGFGLSVIEASASRLPVVVSDIYGLHDSMIDKVTGLKFKVGNCNSLYNKLNYLIRNPNILERFGNQGLVFVKENYDSKDVAKFLLNYINKISF